MTCPISGRFGHYRCWEIGECPPCSPIWDNQRATCTLFDIATTRILIAESPAQKRARLESANSPGRDRNQRVHVPTPAVPARPASQARPSTEPMPRQPHRHPADPPPRRTRVPKIPAQERVGGRITRIGRPTARYSPSFFRRRRVDDLRDRGLKRQRQEKHIRLALDGQMSSWKHGHESPRGFHEFLQRQDGAGWLVKICNRTSGRPRRPRAATRQRKAS